jgi:molybdate transport system substrate-binding protein
MAAAALIALLAWPSQSGPQRGVELRLYCAAGMTKPVEEARQDYFRRYGVHVNVTYDASGTLLGLARKRDLPADLFLSAEQYYIDQAVNEGLVEEVLPVVPVTAVIAVQKGNPKKVQGLTDLLRPDVAVSFAEPKAAAIGRFAEAVMTQLGLWGLFEKRIAAGQVTMQGTVNKAAADVALKVVDAAVIWDAIARQTGLDIVTDPALSRRKEQVTVGVLRHSRQPTEALRFARFLTSRDQGQPRFARYHFETLPDADVWAERPELLVHAGAMLRPAVADTLQRFAQREGVEVKPVYGGCGLLVAGMANGARPDVYLACDTAFLEKVQDLFEPARDLSRNDAVIIVRKGLPRKVTGLADLAGAGLTVGLADPEKSALGGLSERLLRRAGLYDKLKASGNVEAHAASGDFLVTQVCARALDAAIVYRSNAQATPRNVEEHFDVVEIAGTLQAVQPLAVGKTSDHKHLARRLAAALAGAESRERFKRLGFHWIGDEHNPDRP